jgi:hypothetical protein
MIHNTFGCLGLMTLLEAIKCWLTKSVDAQQDALTNLQTDHYHWGSGVREPPTELRSPGCRDESAESRHTLE